MKRRGRPRSPESSQRDELLARTVYRLILWGFKQRGGIYDVVAEEASKCLERGESEPLGADRVEQIYEQWRKRKKRDWLIPPLVPQRYRRDSFARNRPNLPLPALARILIQKGGRWLADEARSEAGIPTPPPELTVKALREQLQFPMTARMRSDIEKMLVPGSRGRPKKK